MIKKFFTWLIYTVIIGWLKGRNEVKQENKEVDKQEKKERELKDVRNEIVQKIMEMETARKNNDVTRLNELNAELSVLKIERDELLAAGK